MNYKSKWITIVYMKNFFKHLRVVIKHKNLVLIHSYKLGILHLGLVHDLSKFSRKEFLPSVKYFSGNYSPIVNERRNEGLYSSIFTHHTNHNKHHYEYWISEFKGDFILTKIPFKYSLEYVADMIAASKTYLKDKYKKDEPLKFFLARYDHYLMHSMNKEFIKTLLTIYSQSGFKNLKKKRTKKIYDELSKKYPFNEYIHCYSLNSSFKKEDITPEFIEKTLK